VEGKIVHNPEVVEKGKERRTGELKRKKEREDDVRLSLVYFGLVYGSKRLFAGTQSIQYSQERWERRIGRELMEELTQLLSRS
jgi:hypothetical protein